MTITSLATSKKKGTIKTIVDTATLIKNHGFEGDAHAGDWHRQVSFLSQENIDAANERGLDVSFGDFAENIATLGVDWKTLPVGTKVKLGKKAMVEITQIGKVCHKKCAIYYKAGDCIMPKEGVFVKVLEGGELKKGDKIEVV
ncbi:MAG: MOSC domain-containing protein [Desulfobacteraceae bacterium]|nr:MOSC domain-containing protein [Desulfobacteraceae bacterium]